MSSKKVRNLLRFGKLGRAKSHSTTDLTEWSKGDEKLLKAVEGNDVKKVSHILSKKAMVPSKLGPRGRSIFHIACDIGNPAIVDLLLKETDDVNVLTIQGNTCLQFAAAKGHEQVMQLLLQSMQADVNKQDSNDMTALHHACAGRRGRCVGLLLQSNADHSIPDKGGRTALFFAAHTGDKGICELLVSRGADVNAGDKMLVTPLMIAAKEGHRDVCEFLLKRGANSKAVDRDGHTALDFARAENHGDLEEVFAKAPAQASWVLNSTGSGLPSLAGSANSTPKSEAASPVPTHDDTVVTTVTHLQFTPDDTVVTPVTHLQSTPTSVHTYEIEAAEDETSSPHRSPAAVATSLHQLSTGNGKDTQAYKELEAEHEQLTEDYHTLSIENLKLRDKLEFLQKRMNDKAEQGRIAVGVPKEVQDEIKTLKNLLEEEKSRTRELETCLTKSAEGKDASKEVVSNDPDSWHDSEDEELFHTEGKSTKEKNINDKQMLALLRSQILTLRQENDQLRNNAQNGHHESLEASHRSEKTDYSQKIAALEMAKQQLEGELLQLRETALSQELGGSLSQEQLILANAKLQEEVEDLQQSLQQMEVERTDLRHVVARLEQEREAIPSDKVAVLNSAKVMENVIFDEEGFVEGQDLTKEEFLQAQNDQLKMQCGLLTEELSKLRTTFDAILKAGDNLQADYDLLHSEKEALHEQLLKLVQEKEEVVKENEFLLSDGNALHEDLKKLVIELEKMQDKYRRVCDENKQLVEQRDNLQREQSAVTIAGKVGEVARLLEEREKLQVRLGVAEESVERLTHDQAILLEEVQSQQDRIAVLTAERDALQAEMDGTEALLTQHEALTQDYTQLEEDFNELLKEKERLEVRLQTAEAFTSSASGQQAQELGSVLEERDMLLSQREQLEITVQELSQENAQLEEQVVVMRAHLAQGKQQEGVEDDKDATIRQLEITVTELSKENASLEDDLAATHQVITQLEARMTAEANCAVSASDAEVNLLRTGMKQMEATIIELSQENAEMAEELMRLGTDLQHSQEAQRSSSCEDHNKLQRENLTLQSRVTELEKRLSQAVINGETNHSAALTRSSPVNLSATKEDNLLAKLREENSQLREDLIELQSRLATSSRVATSSRLEMANGMLEHPAHGLESKETALLRQQIAQLQQRFVELEENHSDLVKTYRTHLLSAVQGHMDPDVKEALHSIIEMRSMEQFC